jgi:hypothetical protein
MFKQIPGRGVAVGKGVAVGRGVAVGVGRGVVVGVGVGRGVAVGEGAARTFIVLQTVQYTEPSCPFAWIKSEPTPGAKPVTLVTPIIVVEFNHCR